MRAIAEAMTHAGFGVLRLDFTGLGQSEGEFAGTNISSNVTDLVAATQYLKDHFGPVELLVGHSLGGAAAILAALELETVKAVATIGAPSEPVHVKRHFQASEADIRARGEAEVEIGGRSFRVKKQFLDDLETTRMREAIGKLERALLVLHSPVDQTVGIEQATRIFKAAKHPRSFVSVDGADHLLSRDEDAEFVGHIIASWARRYVTTKRPADWRARAPKNRVTARTETGFGTELMANGFALYADEPADVGGTDTGPTPYDYLGSGLAACTAMTLRLYADRKKWPLQAAQVSVEHSHSYEKDTEDMDLKGSRIDHFQRELLLDGDLDDAQRNRLMEIADKCPVHRTLESRARISTKLTKTQE